MYLLRDIISYSKHQIFNLLAGRSVDDNKENKVTAVVEEKRTAFPGLCIPDQLMEDTSKVRGTEQKIRVVVLGISGLLYSKANRCLCNK